MVRILLAVPGPAFLVFSAIQQFQTLVCVGVVCSVSAWGLSASFTELKTGQNFAVYVLLITVPLWILSLLIAQIEKKPPGSVQEWLEAYRDNQLESFTTSTLEAFCKKEGLKVGGKKEKGDLVKSVKKCLQEKEEQEEEERTKKKEEEERRKKESTPTPPPNDTPTPTKESTEAKPKPTPNERLVSLWKYFRGLLKWDPRIWSWPRAFEAFLYFGCIYGYAAIYESNATGWSGVLFIYLIGTPIAVLVANMVTNIVRSIIDYQYDQKVPYHSFVTMQALRLSIHTIFGVGVAAYGMSAMSRVVLTSNLQAHFDDLSLNGIVCTDRGAFWTAFEASAANASCPALPNCGYASFEDLCQAVQYAPMVRAVGVDVSKVLLFNMVAWILISLLVFGTGRATADRNYAQLLSRHVLVAMVLGFAQLVSAFYSFLRLLLLVPLLRLPRPAAYFDRPELMARELPFFLYGRATDFDFWLAIFVHVLIAIALNFDFLQKYASQLRVNEDEEQKAIEELKVEMKKKGDWSDEVPYFYFIPAQDVRDCKTRSLPPMQALRDVGHLKLIKISLVEAFNGLGVINSILFVSHRWEEPGRPDVNGVQLKAIQAFLEKHDEIEWVWFDYSSMPQKISGIDSRTPKEKAEFQLMLTCITDLYLTASVLILLDGSYASRFWTLTEAWCSMQTATSDGLRPSTEAERRYTISCIHNATIETTAKGLEDLVSTKKPEEMYEILKKPDVNITNLKDKAAMLPIIQKTHERVIERFKNGFQQKLTSPQSPPEGSPGPERPPAEPASSEASPVRQSPTLESVKPLRESSSSPASASEVISTQVKYVQASEMKFVQDDLESGQLEI